MRQRAVPGRIFGQIGVEQVNRDHRTRRAADVVLPGAQLDRAAFQRDGGPVRTAPVKNPPRPTRRSPPSASRCCRVSGRSNPLRCSSVTATIGSSRSAAARSMSPASIPRPPLYVGIAGCRAISIEK
jgi:hypothetical protein